MIASTTEGRLRRCLKGLRFPANREDLVAAAIDNGCDQRTVDALRDMAPVTYVNLRQVLASITIVDTPAGDASVLSRDDGDVDDTVN